MMANIRLLVAIFAYFTRLLEATKIEFNRAGVIDADLGERLFFNCSATSDHVIDLLEIGQDHTIDEKLSYDPSQPGTPVTRYEPEGCTFSEEGSQCSKVITITVTEDMVGKAYQCRSFRREYEDHMTYSKGGYVQVKQLSINPPTPTSPPATAILTNAAASSDSGTDTPSKHMLTDGTCECSGTVTVNTSLHLWTLLLPLIVRHLLF